MAEEEDVAAAPSSAPGRTQLLLAGGAIVAAVALVVVGVTRKPSASAASLARCKDARVDDVWNDQVADAIAAEVASTGIAFGATTFTTARRDLDTYAETWVAARDQICNAEDPEADARREGVLACLDRAKARLGALATGLGTPDAIAIERSWRATASLPPISDCGDAGPPAAATDPELHAQLDAAAVLVDLGRLDAAASALDALTFTEDEPEGARALLLRGLLLAERGLVPEAIGELESAAWRSIALDDPYVTFRAATSLARLVSLDPLETEAARKWWHLASAVADRLAASPVRQHELLTVRAMLLHRGGQQRGALALYEPALSLGESNFGTEHPVLLEGLTGAAIAAAEIGEPALGERMAERAIDIASHGLGRTHPDVAEVARAFGAALVKGGKPGDAAVWIAKAVEIRGDAATPDEGVRLRLELGRAWSAAGEHGPAREAFVGAGRWLEKHEADPALRPEVELGLAAALADAGQGGASIDHLRAAVDAQGDDPAALAVRVQLGQALRDAGRFDEARLELGTALAGSIAAFGENDPRVGDARLALADVALATGAADEALALARQAVKAFVEGRGADDPSVHIALVQLGAACLALGQDRDAVAAFERAVVVAKAAKIGAADIAASELSLASALWRVGEEERAEEIARTARRTAAEGEPTDGTTAAAIEDWFARRSLDPQG